MTVPIRSRSASSVASAPATLPQPPSERTVKTCTRMSDEPYHQTSALRLSQGGSECARLSRPCLWLHLQSVRGSTDSTNPRGLPLKYNYDDLFNSAVLAHVIAFAEEIGVFRIVEKEGTIHLSARYPHLPPRLLGIVSESLVAVGALKLASDDSYEAGATFDSCARYKGFFSWLFGASGAYLADAPVSLSGTAGDRPMPVRDGRRVGTATGDFGPRVIDPVLAALPFWPTVRHIADIGCGDGSRLIDFCNRFGAKGTAIEVSEEAIRETRNNILAAGLSDQIEAVHCDVKSLEAHVRFADVDTIISCLMGHDLWPRDQCVTTLASIKTVFSHARRLIVCETVRSVGNIVESGVPSFGYEYLHGVMGQYITSADDWRSVFPEAGWDIHSESLTSLPANTVIFTCIPKS